MKELLRRHHISFKAAWAGVVWALTTQPNFKVHIFFSVCAIALGIYLGITKIEMIVILFTIVLGMTSEMINTSLEAMTDLITTEWKKEAKVAKDVAAGMMLTVAAGAVLISGIIFIPYIVKLFR
jgi:diacylglycerol kinase